jgi:hypothetical protein
LVCGFPPFWKISPQAFPFVSHQFYIFERPAEEVGLKGIRAKLSSSQLSRPTADVAVALEAIGEQMFT